MLNDLAGRREERAAGKVVRWETGEAGQQWEFTCDNGVRLRVWVVSDKIIRFRYATELGFEPDFSYALDPAYQPEPVDFLEFKEKPDHFRITTERLICTISKDGLRARFLDRSGTVLSEDERGFHYEYDAETGNDVVKMTKRVQAGEHYYGLGDKAANANLRGQRLTLWNSDRYGYEKGSDPLYKSIPFYTSVHQRIAHGIFFDNPFQSYFDFAAERTNVTSFWACGGEMNYYFLYGPTLREVTEEYTGLTGRPELPPLWALGFHQSKWSYYPDEQVRALADRFREERIPCDALYLDIDYMDGYRCFTWHPERFPNPRAMTDALALDGFKVVSIIDPGIKIDPDFFVYQQGIAGDHFCRRPDGPLLRGSVWPGPCHFPDYTHPATREWWSTLFPPLIQGAGVAGVWNDMNEPAIFETGTFPNDVRHDYDGHPTSHRRAHNVYGMQMARATHEGVKAAVYPKRPFTISRALYAGGQRYGSCWTGDNIATWEHMWLANVQCQRLSISGVSFTGSDIGGFIDQPTGELFIRWLALGVFHPFMRVHSSGDHGEQEPWSFGEPFTSLARTFIELRYQLLPNLYTAFWQYARRGTPMLRPLVYLDQDDPETYLRMAEFSLGDHLLICPITQADATGRWLYLPAGRWFYWYTDEAVEGKQEIWADAGLDRIPIFVRAGAVVPLWPVQQHVEELEITELILHVYWKNGEELSELYEDAGEGYAYQEAHAQCLKTFRVRGAASDLTLTQVREGDWRAPYETAYIVLHGLPFEEVQGATTDDGAAVDVLLDEATGCPVVRLPAAFGVLVVVG